MIPNLDICKGSEQAIQMVIAPQARHSLDNFTIFIILLGTEIRLSGPLGVEKAKV
jgi:hypothetical protein